MSRSASGVVRSFSPYVPMESPTVAADLREAASSGAGASAARPALTMTREKSRRLIGAAPGSRELFMMEVGQFRQFRCGSSGAQCVDFPTLAVLASHESGRGRVVEAQLG